MKQRLFLHIGTEKTGTTSIQRFLTVNSEILLAQHNILYSKHPLLFDRYAHFPVAGSFLLPKQSEFVREGKLSNKEKIIAAIDEEYQAFSPEIVLLSAEQFSSRFTDNEIQALAEAFKKFDVTILLCLRRQDSMALSSFSTSLLTGGKTWFNPDNISAGHSRYNYLNLINNWKAHFGKDTIKISFYKEEGKSSVHQFLSTFNIHDISPFKVPSVQNSSINIKQAKMFMEINQKLPGWGTEDEKKALYFQANRIRLNLLHLTQNLHSFSGSERIYSILSPEEKEKIFSKFEQINKDISSTYANGVEIFPPINFHEKATNAEAYEKDNDLGKDELIDLILSISKQKIHLEDQLKECQRKARNNNFKNQNALLRAVNTLRKIRQFFLNFHKKLI